MILLEEFEKLITDFEQIEGLSTEEYLVKFVTPTLVKLIGQVAKMRPTNPVDFLVIIIIIRFQIFLLVKKYGFGHDDEVFLW